MMSIWDPKTVIEAHRKYVAIADTIASAVDAGTLSPGARLPTHRELADRLGVTVGTVSRGYEEARRRGLVSGHVGRGTFVSARDQHPDRIALAIPTHESAELIDLSRNYALLDARNPALEGALERFGRRLDLTSLLNYQPQAGNWRDREAGARWVRRLGMPAEPEHIVVTCGAQHSMLVALSTLTAPGDAVLAEQVAYPGIKGIARMLNLRLDGVPLDSNGMRPAAFEQLCRDLEPKALYCTPTVQNPTASVMPVARRREIAAIAAAHEVAIVEDDTYGFLLDEPPPPLASFAGPRGYYVTGLAKAIVPGLRIGYICAPPSAIAGLGAIVMASTWMPAPAMAMLSSALIDDGVAEEVVAWKRTQADRRMAIAREVLGDHCPRVAARTMHVWLTLPEPWRADEFVVRARERGVELTAPGQFAIGRRYAVPQSLRVCIGAPRTDEDLRRGLGVVSELLSTPPPVSALV